MSKPFTLAARLRNLTCEEIVDLVAGGDFVGAVALKEQLPRWAVEEACAEFLAELIQEDLCNGSHNWAWYLFETQESAALVAALERAGLTDFLREQEAWKN